VDADTTLPEHAAGVRSLEPVPIVFDFNELYRAQVRPLTALAFSLTGRWHVAEEVVQDVFTAALGRGVRRLDQPEAWLRRAVTNRCASHFRRTYLEHRSLARLRQEDEWASPPLEDVVWALVRRLPRRQAEAVALRYAADLSRRDVALTMRCSEEAVKTHLQRATIALKSLMESEGLENESG
jgi:RNA polymerase sigma factor (sigma-70 family)